MLHMHRKMNKYTQFGGHIELDETPWQSVRHELEEETGYTMEQVMLLQPARGLRTIGGAVVHPYPVVHATMGYGNDRSHYHTDVTYAFVTDKEPRNTPDEGESTDLRLFTRAEFAALGEDMIDKVTYDSGIYIFDEVLAKWGAVPPDTFK